MKFLYLIKRPLVQRDFERFGIGSLLARGHEVTVLDFSNLIHPKISHDQSKAVRIFGLTLRVLESRADLKAEKETFAESDLIFFLIQSQGLSRATYSVLTMIAETGTPYLIQASALYPGATMKMAEMPFWKSARDCLVRLRKMDLVNSIVARLPRTWLGIPEAAYVIYNGLASRRKNNLVGPRTKPVNAHTMDFDIYLRQGENSVEPKNQAVFIDQFLPYHLDFRILKAEGAIDSNRYYGCLRALFDRIEKDLQLEVVIASHPRSDYERYKGVFGDRLIHHGNNAAEIARSRLVLAHYSTAIGFAVMFRKPIMLLTSQELYEHHPFHKFVYDGFSRELGVPLHFFDDPNAVDLSDAMSIDDDLYDSYIRNYIKAPGSPAGYLWDIVCAEIGA